MVETNELSINENTVQENWDRLLVELEKEIEILKEKGNKVIPIIDFKDVIQSENGNVHFSERVISEVRKTGVVVIRNVIPKEEARELKFELEDYMAKNSPKLREANRSMFHLFWTPSQLKARSHPNMILLQQALMSIWHSPEANEKEVSTKFPLVFADRFRIRPAGEKMTLPPHVDGGFIGTGNNKSEFTRVFAEIFQDGKWEDYDPFDYTARLDALYNEEASKTGYGNAAFRMFQGWLSMSSTGPGGGTLQVNPLLKYTSAYATMRPFFASSPDFKGDPSEDDPSVPWKYVGRDVFNGEPSRRNMNETHPHLKLEETMISVPFVEPGDYVAWHCDIIHAVEAESHGPGDASVMYIPAVPLTEDNINYVLEQREAFKKLSTTKIFQPPTDEVSHAGAGSIGDISGKFGLQAMGLGHDKFDITRATSEGERKILERANERLFA